MLQNILEYYKGVQNNKQIETCVQLTRCDDKEKFFLNFLVLGKSTGLMSWNLAEKCQMSPDPV